MHLLETHMDTPTWWPYRDEELDADIPDANRPPQLDLCRLGSRNGCACFSSRESTGGQDDSDDGSVTAVESYHEEASDFWMLGTPDVQSGHHTALAFLHHGPGLDELETDHDHGQLADSMLVCLSGSPTESLITGTDTRSPSIFGVDIAEDYLGDMNLNLPRPDDHANAPFYLPDIVDANRKYVLRCKHVHNELCFEWC